MSLYLRVVSVEEAIAALIGISPPPKIESIGIAEAEGRILATEVIADTDLPGFDRSTVDGYAVRAGDTTGASESVPAMLSLAGSVPMGAESAPPLPLDACMYVPTGAVLPPQADAVVMVEHTERIGETILVKRGVAQGENVIRRGEDFRRGQVAVPRGRVLRPQEIGVCAAAGAVKVQVYARPEVGILSTGNELVPIEEVPSSGRVRDVNSHMLAAALKRYACVPRCYGIAPDEEHEVQARLARAASECDLVLVSGGSSKDTRDRVASGISQLGRVLVHGVAIQPGKPTIIGEIAGKPVVGLPGHPASAFVVFHVIVRPVLSRLTGIPCDRAEIRAVLAESVPSAKGREEYVRVRLEGSKAWPIFGKSGLLNTLVESDGMIRIPAAREGVEAGEVVEVLLW